MADDDSKALGFTPDLATLTLAAHDDVKDSLSFALRFNGRKRVHDSDEAMARITAARLVEHLRLSGYVIMKSPPRKQVSISLCVDKPN